MVFKIFKFFNPSKNFKKQRGEKKRDRGKERGRWRRERGREKERKKEMGPGGR